MIRDETTRSFGRNPSPLDVKDYPLKSYIPRKVQDLSGRRQWNFLATALDQGQKPHCIGFAGANFGINDPIQDDYTNETGADFYYKCKIVDGEPGQENGSSVRSIAKVLRNEGRIANYAFTYATDEITWWLLNKGPLIVGTLWTAGMMIADDCNVIHPTGAIAGGHGYLLNAKTEFNYYRIQNSWNGYWGINGQAYISIADFAALLHSGGEALAAVECPLSEIPVKNDGCLLAFIKALTGKP